jgi:hypothetical protein
MNLRRIVVQQFGDRLVVAVPRSADQIQKESRIHRVRIPLPGDSVRPPPI